MIINTDNNEFSIALNLNDIFAYLDNRFKLVHRACIANIDRIEEFNWPKGYFVLDTGKKVPMLSKKYKKEIEENHENGS